MANVDDWFPVEDDNTHLDQFSLHDRINPSSPLNRYTKKLMSAVKKKSNYFQDAIDGSGISITPIENMDIDRIMQPGYGEAVWLQDISI